MSRTLAFSQIQMLMDDFVLLVILGFGILHIQGNQFRTDGPGKPGGAADDIGTGGRSGDAYHDTFSFGILDQHAF